MAQLAKLLWTRPALEHLREIREFIAVENPGAATRQIDRIESAGSYLKNFPKMGRNGIIEGTREMPVPNTPYCLIYREEKAAVQILAVLHGARNRRR